MQERVYESLPPASYTITTPNFTQNTSPSKDPNIEMQNNIQEAVSVATANQQYTTTVVKTEQIPQLYPQSYIVQAPNGHPATAEYVQASAGQVSPISFIHKKAVQLFSGLSSCHLQISFSIFKNLTQNSI